MTSHSEARDAAVAKVRTELRRSIRQSDKTQKAIEEENGFARGYLSQVLGGNMSLTARHIFGILLSLDVTPGAFFAKVFSEDPGAGEELSEIRQRMSRYDNALRELEEQGLVSPADAEPRD